MTCGRRSVGRRSVGRRSGGRYVARAAAVALPIAASVVLTGISAAPAAAAGTFASPDAGLVVDHASTVQIRVRLGPITRTTQLHLRGPDGADHVVATGQSVAGGDTLAYDFATDCPTYPGMDPCAGRHPATDGTWTAYLTGGGSAQRSFDVRVPPAAPADLSVAPADLTTARVTWALGAEPDLTTYDVTTADGRALLTGLAAGDVCADGRCGADVDFGAAAAGHHDVAVVAHRSCAGCPDADLASPASDPASVTLAGRSAGPPAAPGTPSPAPAPGGARASAPGSAGTAGGGPAARQRRAFAAAVGAAGLGAAALPALPTPADVTRIPAPYGTYSPRLGYRVSPRDAVRAPQVAAAPSLATALRDHVASLTERRRVWQGLATALLLVVVALHLRRWATTTRRG